MSELVIDFKNTGEVSSLHMDAFDLGFLGDKKVFRQTDIVFDDETQLWNIIYLIEGATQFHDSALYGFNSYETARKFEVLWLNDCRLMGIPPASADGVEAMKTLRGLE